MPSSNTLWYEDGDKQITPASFPLTITILSQCSPERGVPLRFITLEIANFYTKSGFLNLRAPPDNFWQYVSVVSSNQRTKPVYCWWLLNFMFASSTGSKRVTYRPSKSILYTNREEKKKKGSRRVVHIFPA